jgi:hypothetical protein
MLDERAAALYEDEVGEIRNLPEEHPDAWQWRYRGSFSQADRERMLDLIQDAAEAEQAEQLSLL